MNTRAHLRLLVATLALALPVAAEQQPASRVGSEAFIASGCGACHTVRGVVEAGAVGPDLTHLMARKTIAAGTLPNTPANLLAWIGAPDHIKPGARMPPAAVSIRPTNATCSPAAVSCRAISYATQPPAE